MSDSKLRDRIEQAKAAQYLNISGLQKALRKALEASWCEPPNLNAVRLWVNQSEFLVAEMEKASAVLSSLKSVEKEDA